MAFMGHDFTCTKCDGKGWLAGLGWLDSHHHFPDGECDECRGSGKVLCWFCWEHPAVGKIDSGQDGMQAACAECVQADKESHESSKEEDHIARKLETSVRLAKALRSKDLSTDKAASIIATLRKVL